MNYKFWAELLGTSFLVMIVLGSGIMGQNLFPGNDGLALFVNALATGAGLFVLIQCLGTISGAHLNPIVSIVEFFWGRIGKSDLVHYIHAQIIGAYLGTIFTHLMFNLPAFVISNVERGSPNLFFSEIVATFGLIVVIALSGKRHVEFAPLSIAAYIASGYWFTSSTALTNPAVSFARIFTNSFGGMSPKFYFPFLFSQLLGAFIAILILRPFAPLELFKKR